MNGVSQTIFDSKAAYQYILLTLTIFFLVPCRHSLGSDPLQETSESTARGLPVETRKFELVREPNEDDTPGALTGGGYLWRDVTVKRYKYRAAGPKIGGATVETIEHSQGYPYVLHDFFGIYAVNQIGKSFDNNAVEQRFVNWTGGNPDISGTICVTVAPNKGGVFGGNIGWYSRVDDRLRTVVIGFDQLDGVPVQVIDEFLEKYPSSVKEEDLDAAGWVGDDVHKWIHLLQLHKGDRPMFQQALGRLARYDRKLFGVDPKRLDVDDPAMFERAIEDVKQGAERWLQDREAKKGQERDD